MCPLSLSFTAHGLYVGYAQYETSKSVCEREWQRERATLRKCAEREMSKRTACVRLYLYLCAYMCNAILTQYTQRVDTNVKSSRSKNCLLFSNVPPKNQEKIVSPYTVNDLLSLRYMNFFLGGIEIKLWERIPTELGYEIESKRRMIRHVMSCHVIFVFVFLFFFFNSIHWLFHTQTPRYGKYRIYAMQTDRHGDGGDIVIVLSDWNT